MTWINSTSTIACPWDGRSAVEYGAPSFYSPFATSRGSEGNIIKPRGSSLSPSICVPASAAKLSGREKPSEAVIIMEQCIWPRRRIVYGEYNNNS